MQSASPGGYANAPVGSPSAGPGASASAAAYGAKPVNGGRFDFDDGGTYCGGWEDGKAHGHGVCTGPKGQGEYAGSWHFGFEVSGVYTWPSGSTFEGQWQNGKRHGLGTEYRGRWTYRGEWTQGFKGRYGVRQATASNAKYEGTWANGLQDGYGSETYADGGTYQGQWLRGLRHGYGVRTSAPFGMASHFRPKAAQGSMASLKSESAAEPTSERDRRMDDVRGGFVLKARSDEPPARRRSLVERSSNIKDSILKGLKLRKQRSTGDLDKRGTSSSIRSNGSSASWMSNESAQSAVLSGSHHTDSNASFVVEDEMMDASVTETYMGEWKNDKRSGFGISERSDGLKYEGEWYNNKKYGYGVTTFKEGTKEEGKYKNNVLITSQKKKHLFLIRSAKFRERIDAAVNAAQRASKIALQKADIAISRTATARGKAEQADIGAAHAREDSDIARVIAKQFAPDFHQPGTEVLKPVRGPSHQADLSKLALQSQQHVENPQLRGYQTSGGATNSRFDEPQNTVPISSFTRPQTSIPDRLDRNSLINQPIDQPSAGPSALSSQFHSQSYNQPSQLQPQQQQQQQYNNRVGEVPSAGYQSAALRMSHQNVMDVSASESNKMSQNPNVRNSYQMDSSPHSQMMDGGMNMPPTVGHDRGRDTLRRNQGPPQNQMRSSSAVNPASSAYNFQQAMSDHFDHYKRPPSRDSSVDRFGGRTRSRTRAVTPDLGPAISHSRPPSRARTPFMETPQAATGGLRGASNPALDALLMDTPDVRRGATPSRNSGIEPPSAAMFADSALSGAPTLEDAMLRQRVNIGQDIPAVPYTPKRTESLFLKPGAPKPAAVAMPKISGGGGGGGGGGGAGGVPKRKKSLPDAVTLPKATMGIPREELASLGSARRQELHRMQEEAERYKANPFLYLLNPNVKNWFSRQKLVVLVLFVNLSLAIMFLQLLT